MGPTLQSPAWDNRAPKNRRWPIRIDLAELADALGPSSDKSLFSLAERESDADALQIDLKPVTLRQWLRRWPWLLVLDGLDEVTSPEVRRRILDEIESFVDEADEEDADLLVVVTTRPTGYTERIAPSGILPSSTCGTSMANPQRSTDGLVTVRRLADDLDRRDQVLARFAEACD